MLAFALALVAASAALGVLLTSRAGRRLGLRLMYGLAALPGVVLLQVRTPHAGWDAPIARSSAAQQGIAVAHPKP